MVGSNRPLKHPYFVLSSVSHHAKSSPRRGQMLRAGAAIAAQRVSRVVRDRNRECCVLKIARALLQKQTFTLEGAQQYRKERRRHWSAMNTCLVPGCGKTFRSERGLISHTEAVHGRDNVHRGMRAWERSRQQQGAVTVGEATEHNQEWDLEGEDFEYDFPEDEWVCCHCGKRSAQKRDILAHLKSGAHEVPRYYCADCPKKFKSMQALLSHFEMTGHSRPQQRLTSVSCLFCRNRRSLLSASCVFFN